MTISPKIFDRARAPVLPISFQPGKKWYVVYANIKCEFRAEKGLRAKGYDVFLPRARRWVRHARKKTERVVPLLPRYVFSGFDINLIPCYWIRTTARSLRHLSHT